MWESSKHNTSHTVIDGDVSNRFVLRCYGYFVIGRIRIYPNRQALLNDLIYASKLSNRNGLHNGIGIIAI